jgi:nucleotide-binding universal stress UspA family protein
MSHASQQPPPVVIAYDGSELSQTAVKHAAELFPGRPTVIATVWEPGLAMMATTPSVGLDPSTILPDAETIDEVDRSQREHAAGVAEEGVQLARALGLAAEPHAVADEVNVADTLLDLARERNAAAIVLGSHGISGLRSRLLGSVSRKLIENSDRPVLLIRGERR